MTRTNEQPVFTHHTAQIGEQVLTSPKAKARIHDSQPKPFTAPARNRTIVSRLPPPRLCPRDIHAPL